MERKIAALLFAREEVRMPAQVLHAKCGNDCSWCPSFRESLVTDQDRQRCSAGWLRYHGFRYSPEKLLRCDGCQAPDENPVRYLNCLVRKCAQHNSAETCANCASYACEELLGSIPAADWRDGITNRLGAPIPKEDDLAFVAPYECLRNLDTLRASLDPEQIVEPSRLAVRFRTVDLPEYLPLPHEKRAAIQALHHLLVALNAPAGSVSYARRKVLKQRRSQQLKLLWVFGLLGQLEGGERARPRLVVDSQVYYAHKLHSDYSTVKGCLEALQVYGVQAEIVPLVEGGWLTPTGALRKTVGRKGKPAWLMELSFDEQAGGAGCLAALQSYARRLEEGYGKRAYRYFAQADMRSLREERR
jgi:hypothetical protein